MDKDAEKSFIKAGEILAKARKFGLPLIKEGKSLLEAADKIEAKIIELGGGIGFPTNISLNEMAAHDIPDANDQRLFKSGDVVKLDIGVHFDGYVADSAVAVIVGDNELGEQMKKVNEHALNEAIKMFKPGVKMSDVSAAIEHAIRNHGFAPVANLTGHRIGRWVVHDSPSVPNVHTSEDYVLQEGDVFAIEPFVTNGKGLVNEVDRTQIYSYLGEKNIRLPEGKKILSLAKNDYNTLPFAARWLVKAGVSPLKLRMALIQLTQSGGLHAYPALREASGALVTQMEHSLIVKEKPIVFTRDAE